RWCRRSERTLSSDALPRGEDPSVEGGRAPEAHDLAHAGRAPGAESEGEGRGLETACPAGYYVPRRPAREPSSLSFDRCRFLTVRAKPPSCGSADASQPWTTSPCSTTRSGSDGWPSGWGQTASTSSSSHPRQI